MNDPSKVQRGHEAGGAGDARPRVTLYSAMYCGYCTAAKRLLDRQGIAFEEVDLTHDRALREQLSRRFGGYRTVPMIVLDGRFIGGFRELVALERAGGLARVAPDPDRSRV